MHQPAQHIRAIDFLRRKTERETFLDLVYLIRFTLSREPQDKIYGLFSLASDRAKYETPDYRRSLERVLHRFCSHDFV